MFEYLVGDGIGSRRFEGPQGLDRLSDLRVSDGSVLEARSRVRAARCGLRAGREEEGPVEFVALVGVVDEYLRPSVQPRGLKRGDALATVVAGAALEEFVSIPYGLTVDGIYPSLPVIVLSCADMISIMIVVVPVLSVCGVILVASVSEGDPSKVFFFHAHFC